MKTVGIVGVGLIGGSFGLALRKAGYSGTILGVSSRRSLDEALERGAIDRGATLEDAAAASDLLFLSQPISGILKTLRVLDALVRPETLVTDAGSTKRAIVEEAARSLRRCVFLGGHPMAGKELRGAAAADADLFRGRPWILTSTPDHPVAAELRKWIGLFGAREIILDAAQHDRLAAWSSHLPQLASTALASLLHDRAPDAATVAGPGLIDSTRLAMSSFDLWRDILETNQTEIAAALDAYIEKLRALKADFETEFDKGSAFARSLRERR
jgi:prephenate dehydrogenase